jgi:hypothetical protein
MTSEIPSRTELARPSQVQIFSSTKAIQSLKNRRFCWLSSSGTRMIDTFQDIPGLTQFQKNSILNRYITLTETFRRRAILYAFTFHIGRTIVTVGSLIVPALLSIQYTESSTSSTQNISYQIYWITWCISLLVTTCNGVLTLFKVEKKYYFIHTLLELFKSEMWQYIHLSGKYGGHYIKNGTSTHENQYIYFCHNIEKLKLKQIDEEYYKAVDSNQNRGSNDKNTTIEVTGSVGNSSESKTIAGMYAPTPGQDQLLAHQQELAKALVPPAAAATAAGTGIGGSKDAVTPK